MFAVPNGLPPELAALTEPMAVGWHAVRRAEIKKGDVAIVIGCGPVGLAVICMLKAAGRSDDRRERLLRAAGGSSRRACGADVVVDPSDDSPYDAPGDARPPEDDARGRRSSRSTRWRSCGGCRCPGITSGAWPRRSARSRSAP